MNDLGDLLKQHKKFFPPDMVIREALAHILNTRLKKETFTRKDVRVQGRTAFVSCSPIERSEITLSKKEILNELRERITPHVIDDIR